MSEKTYVPASLVMVLRSTPVSELRRVTDAFATTAPVESRTTPLSDAVESCARAVTVEKTRIVMRHSRMRKQDAWPRESVMDSSSLFVSDFPDQPRCNPFF